MDNVNGNTNVNTNVAGNVPAENGQLNNGGGEVWTQGFPETPNTDNNSYNDIIDNIPAGNEVEELQDLLGSENGVFSGVDLRDFGDVLDFDSQESRAVISEYIQELKGQGLTASQIQYIAGKQVDLYKEAVEETLSYVEKESSAKPSPQEIRAVLEQELSVEEKRNLKPMAQWIRNTVGSDILDGEVMTNIFSDPTAIKIVNALYKASLGNVNRVVEPRQTVPEKSMPRLSPQVAMDYYKDWLGRQNSVTREQTVEQIGKLRGYINSDDLSNFDDLFSVLL